jgi:hypothetical protein
MTGCVWMCDIHAQTLRQEVKLAVAVETLTPLEKPLCLSYNRCNHVKVSKANSGNPMGQPIGEMGSPLVPRLINNPADTHEKWRKQDLHDKTEMEVLTGSHTWRLWTEEEATTNLKCPVHRKAG